MKKLTLFLTLSLLTLIGASTVVKAEEPAKQPIDVDPNAVILEEQEEATQAENEVMDEDAKADTAVEEADTAAAEASTDAAE